ncbi:MAG: hypothetical protein IJA56_07845 [Clostridia bacterium]|nr:hypothetical protein [Clostridia bacterium]
MKKQMNRLLSLLLSLVMVLGMLPAVTPHVHATEHIDSVTLTSGTGVVTPAAVLDNVVVYNIWTAENYTLTTTPDNTYGVFFRTYYSREWIVDEWYTEGGYYETDDLAEITLDNVTIRTQNPRHAETAGDAVNRYGALTFWAADMAWNGQNQQGKEYMGVIVDVKGTNTVELLGVENDTAEAKWSAVSFVNCYGNFYGRGSNATLNATIDYDNAMGEAAALRGTSSINFGDAYNEYDDETPVTINVVAQVTGADGTTKYGNGIDIIDYSLNCVGDTNLNIVANDTGILRRYEKYANWMQFTDSTVAVAAGKAAIINEGVNDDHKLCAVRFENCTVEMGGIYVGSELVDPLDSGINAAGYIDFCETIAAVTAVDIALNSAYDLGGAQSYNHESYVQVRDNSDVTVTGSMGEQEDAFSSPIAAIDTGAYYAAVYVKWGSKLTVNAGWLAMVATSIDVGADSELQVNTVYPSDDGALSCSQLMAFGASTSDENSKPAKVRIDSAAAELGVGRSCEFDSNDVQIHTAGGAPIGPLRVSHTIYLEEGILVMESVDGENWQPISNGRNSLDTMRWLTTIPQSSHICANDDKSAWVKVEDADQHTAPCLVCGETLTRDCEYVYYNYYPEPTATTDGEISYKCEVGSKSHYKDIIVPAHNCADYVNKWEDYGNATRHEGACTYFVEAAGIPCGNEVYVDHTFTEWSGDSLTVSRTCTDCGYVESKSTHENVTHMEAIAGDCSKPGRIEFWHCTDPDCGLYFSDAQMTQVVAPEDTFTTPGAHSYGEDGVCTVCGDKKTTVTFIEYEDNNYSSDMDGELFILVGFKDGKAYVMGNETNDDGSRNAVEIPVKANGAIDADSTTAEFFAFDFDEVTLSPDGGYMSMMNGKIVVYDKGRVDEDGLPEPIIFSQNSSYSDETGYLLNYTNDWCIVFDAETPSFKVTDTPADSIVRYKQVCPHENLRYTPAAEATCTEQGAVEYWYCDECYGYFMNHDFEKAVEIDNETELTKKATGHKFDADGICENCGMKRHVYTQVSTLAEFDALSEDASYIIVFKDLEELATVPDVGGGEGGDAIPSSESGVEEVIPGEDDGSGDTPPPGGSGTDIAPDVEFSGKTYAAYYPDVNAFDQMVSADSDGDGVVDLLETDANANGIPDIVEEYIDTQCDGADADKDGTTTADEYKLAIGSYDEDEDVDIEDYKLFFSYNVEDWLYNEFWEENAINHLNIVEVTVASDGSITVTDEGAMEFQMMVSGVWGSQPNEDWMLEEYGITENERMRAAWIPNYWIGASGMMGYSGEEYFFLGERYYGDGEYPGIIDHKNWKISFREDGTACLVNSWTDLEDTGALQLAKYTDSDGNTRLTIVGLPEWQWEYSDIMMNCTALLPAYLYASEPVYNEPPHTCEWGPWEDDDVTDTHTRHCTVEGCTKKQTKAHNWDDGVQTEAPTCTEPGTSLYTCPDCGAAKTESISALDHDWSDWTYDSVDSHVRSCKRNCGVEQEIGGHEWGDWVPVDDTTHKMVCDLCTGEQTGEHDWDNGAITKEPSEYEAGVTTYTCQTCSHTRTEPIDKLPHEHTWTDWEPDGEENHKRTCMDEACAAVETVPHNWDEGKVTTEPTCTESGVKTYTCQTCSHTKTEGIPANGHQYESMVVQWSTCSSEGLIQDTCSVCGNMTETTMEIDPDAHEWGEWRVTKRPTYTEAGKEQRICNLNSEHVQPREIASLVCYHTCAACGLCTDADCERTPKCICGSETKDVLVSAPVKEEHIEVNTDNIELPAGQTISVVANTVKLPSMDETVTSQPAVNPYEEFILNNAEGMKVETVFEIGLQVTDASGNSGSYELKDEETAEVRLFVGTGNAEAIDKGQMYLIHITGGTTITYGKDKQSITAEKTSEGYTGFVTFTTDGFSPFVLVSLPGDLKITVNGVGAANSCTVSISANQAYNCSLYLAAYDSEGKMLAVKVVDNCNLAANPQYTLEFSDTAAYVKAFMMETDGGFTPRCASVTDDKLND